MNILPDDPSSTVLIAALAFAMAFVMAVVAGWHKQKARAITLGATGTVMMLTTDHLYVVQSANADEASPVGPLHTWPIALRGQEAVMIVLVIILISTIKRQQFVAFTSVLLLLTMSFTAYADLRHYKSFQSYWYDGVSTGQIFTMVAAIIFVAALVWAYGQHQYKKGQINGQQANVTVLRRAKTEVHMRTALKDGELVEVVDHVSQSGDMVPVTS